MEETKYEVVSPTGAPDVEIKLVPNTIFLMCGPTMCGKSSFAANLRIEANRKNLTAQVLSSDTFRAQLLLGSADMNLLGGDLRHADSAMAVSGQAFTLLFAHLKATTSFPVNTEVVIVDTTGMNEQFREEVYQVAQEHEYKVVVVTFEYRSQRAYTPDWMPAEQRQIVERSLWNFNRKTLPAMKLPKWVSRVKVKDRYSVPKIVNATELNTKKSFMHLDGSKKYAVIGDVHECVEQTRELISKIEAAYPGIQKIFIGDYLDKGSNTAETVRFINERVQEHGDLMVRGNHEAFVARRLSGEVAPDPVVENMHFPSFAVVKDDKELADMVQEIWKNSADFLIIDQGGAPGQKPVYLTHAPCLEKNLGKTWDFAVKNQRNYRTIDRSRPVLEEFAWLYAEANNQHPLHIFGHLAHKAETIKDMKYKNRVFLDTGCVYGGKLSAVIIANGGIENLIQVDGVKKYEGELPVALGKGPTRPVAETVEQFDLSPRELRQLRQIKSNDVRYISGTMAPGPSSKTEIEPLEDAIRMFKARGATSVTLQPKYMGSRGQLYLFNGAPEKTFFASRGGFKIRRFDNLTDEQFQAFCKTEYEKREDRLKMFGNMILDGEILPWYSIGKGLIEQTFKPYADVVGRELVYLGLDTTLDMFPEFKASLNLPTKVGHWRQFNSVLEVFGSDAPASYQPFDLLYADNWDAVKAVMKDGDNAYNRFGLVNELIKDPFGAESDYLIDLPDDEVELARRILGAKMYFERITVKKRMEGVVIKPVEGDYKIPYMKVRSPEYLRLVYGYDWMDRSERLCSSKNVSRKITVSIEEHELGAKMLQVPVEDKKQLELVAAQMIGKMRQETSLDPRL